MSGRGLPQGEMPTCAQPPWLVSALCQEANKLPNVVYKCSIGYLYWQPWLPPHADPLPHQVARSRPARSHLAPLPFLPPPPPADVLDPSKSTLHADPLKHALRQAGALEAAAQVAADHAGALSDASPTMQTVRSLWRLHK